MAGGVLWLLAHRQQTIRRHAFVRHRAEEPARRQAGIICKHLEVVAGGKPLAEFPGIDGGNRQAQIPGNFLQGNVVLPSPRAERGCEAGPDVTVETRVWIHAGRLCRIRAKGKGLVPPRRRSVVGRIVRRVQALNAATRVAFALLVEINR